MANGGGDGGDGGDGGEDAGDMGDDVSTNTEEADASQDSEELTPEDHLAQLGVAQAINAAMKSEEAGLENDYLTSPAAYQPTPRQGQQYLLGSVLPTHAGFMYSANPVTPPPGWVNPQAAAYDRMVASGMMGSTSGRAPQVSPSPMVSGLQWNPRTKSYVDAYIGPPGQPSTPFDQMPSPPTAPTSLAPTQIQGSAPAVSGSWATQFEPGAPAQIAAPGTAPLPSSYSMGAPASTPSQPLVAPPSGIVSPPDTSGRLKPWDIAWTPEYDQWAAQQDLKADVDRGLPIDQALMKHPAALGGNRMPTITRPRRYNVPGVGLVDEAGKVISSSPPKVTPTKTRTFTPAQAAAMLSKITTEEQSTGKPTALSGMKDQLTQIIKSGVPEAAPPSDTPAPLAKSEPGKNKRVTTKAQYDALAPGTVYIGANGKRYRKPVAE